jgi:hypothetical protein
MLKIENVYPAKCLTHICWDINKASPVIGFIAESSTIQLGSDSR